MPKIILILINLLFFVNLTAEQLCNLDIAAKCVETDGKAWHCELILSVPSGYKLPKAPDISPTEPKNPKEFKYDGKLEQTGETSYRVDFTIVAENSEYIELTADCPMCGNNICSIVSKTVRIALPTQKNGHDSNIFWIILLGFLGGLMLNIMPCALPVVIMKLKSAMSREALCGSIVGNYASFAAFTACLAFLKSAGSVVGWGMHFQNPYFLEAMTFVLFGLTLYSFDMIPLFPSIQIENRKRGVFFENFFSSMVASLAAIPCTAPFLGTAATFAILGSVADMCMIFFAVATGFSLPYFLSFFVSINFFSKFRDGGIVFKKIINCGVLITFLWIFWLLSNHLSRISIGIYAASFISATILLKMRKYRSVLPVAAMCFCGLTFRDFSAESLKADGNVLTLLRSELQKNRIIVFNITADWCLTCKYNSRIFENEEVVKLFKNNDVKFIEADMTKKDDALMQFIGKHGRVGIPFTAIYGPHAENGVLLGEIPTVDEITNAVKKAAGK
ncbi:MAG: thioredoxin family protein [Holosporaceae bacterium]|nr:thioredoxin family protein [Holosporaceae bacterium]